MRGSVLILLLAAVGCSSESSNSGSGGGGAVCTPGATQPCVGPGSCSGGQVCLPDGSAWGSCGCSGTGGGGGASGSGGVSGSGGMAGSGGSGGAAGAAAKLAYLAYSKGDKARVTRIDAETGSVLLNSPDLTCPLLGGDARSIAVDAAGVPRVAWRDSKKNGRVDFLNPTTLDFANTSQQLTHPSASIAFAYARHNYDAVMLWGEFNGPFYRWDLDTADNQVGSGDGTSLTTPKLGLFPVAAAWEGAAFHILWSSGLPDAILTKYDSSPSDVPLPTLSNGMIYRSVTVETGRVRVVITDDTTMAVLCTYANLASIQPPSTSVGWGIGECADIYLSGWIVRGYASRL